MSQRTNLLDEYNRTLRRKLGHESLSEKIEAIRNGTGFRLQPMGRARALAESIDQNTMRPSARG